MRILGLDFGEKKMGLAISTGKVALPFGVIPNNQRFLPELKKICQEEEVKAVVIGLPLNLDGTKGEMTQKVKDFGQGLEAKLGLRVSFWDERLTTWEAKRGLEVRKPEDGRAAALALQSFLDSNL